MRKDLVAAAVLAVLSMGAAGAASAEGFYAGVGFGQANVEVDGGFDDGDTAFKILGGYEFNDNFAAELAYIDGGTAEDFGIEVDSTIITAAVHGIVPVGETFELFGKVGFAQYEIDVDAGVFGSGSDKEEELLYGIGAAVNLGESFKIRAEWEAINVSDGDASVLSISGIYKFGG